MRISDWSSDVCSSDLFDRAQIGNLPEATIGIDGLDNGLQLTCNRVYPDRLPAILHRDRSQNEAVGQAVGRVEGSVIVEACRLAALSDTGPADFPATLVISPIAEIYLTPSSEQPH